MYIVFYWRTPSNIVLRQLQQKTIDWVLKPHAFTSPVPEANSTRSGHHQWLDFLPGPEGCLLLFSHRVGRKGSGLSSYMGINTIERAALQWLSITHIIYRGPIFTYNWELGFQHEFGGTSSVHSSLTIPKIREHIVPVFTVLSFQWSRISQAHCGSRLQPFKLKH